MGNRMRSMYAGLASRFAHLALGAKAEDEEEERAEGETEEGDDEEAREEEPAEEEKKGKKGKKAKKSKSEGTDEKDGDGDDEDEDDDGDAARARDAGDDEGDGKKALCMIKAYKEGRAFERARWGAVLSSAAAHGRVPLACSLLADTKMSAEKVCAALAASPTESRQGLAARMAAVPRPDVGSSAPTGAQPDVTTPKGRAAEMRKAYDKALGVS